MIENPSCTSRGNILISGHVKFVMIQGKRIEIFYFAACFVIRFSFGLSPKRFAFIVLYLEVNHRWYDSHVHYGGLTDDSVVHGVAWNNQKLDIYRLL